MMILRKFFTYGVCYLRINLGKKWAALGSSVGSSWKLRVSSQQLLEALGNSWQLWTAPGQLWAPPGSSGKLFVALDGSWQHRARRTYPVEERKEMQQSFEAVIQKARDSPGDPIQVKSRFSKSLLRLALGRKDTRGTL